MSGGDNPVGILTTTDRELLASDEEMTDNADNVQKRYRLRNRVRQAIVDFGLLYKQLPEHDRELIFSPTGDTERDRDFAEGLFEMLMFVYEGMLDAEQDPRAFIRRAIASAESRRRPRNMGVSAIVDVRISEQYDIDDILLKIDDGVALTEEEIGALFQNIAYGRLDEEYAEILLDHVRDHGIVSSARYDRDAKELMDQYGGRADDSA